MKEKLKQEYKENHEIEKELNLNEESITEEKQNNDKSKENQKIKKILKPIKNILLLIMPFILTLIIEWFYLKVNTTITVSQIIKRKTFIFSVLFIYSIYFILL